MKYYNKKFTEEDNVPVYQDSAVVFETNSFIERLIDSVLIPVLNSLPSGLQKVIKKSHKSAKKVIENKTTHEALEVLYSNGVEAGNKYSVSEKMIHKIWFNTNNSKGVRNRLGIVRNEIKKASESLLEKGEDIRMLSIASGSARAVLEAIYSLDISNNKNVAITFLDKSPNALKYSKSLARELGMLDKNKYDLRWVEDTASNFTKHFTNNSKPNIVEMVGLLDYFSKEKTQDIFEMIYKNIDDGGVLIAANINYNKEMKFVTNVINWQMNYKTGKELAIIAGHAEFSFENISIYYEPLKVHSVIVARK